MFRLLEANLREAVASLLSSKQRSVLALVGISIGIGSVIAVISIGTIVKEEALTQFRRMGTDVLTIRNASQDAREGRARVAAIGLRDALKLAELRSIVASAPYMQSSGQATLSGKTTARVHVVGVTAVFADLAALDVEEGRFISDLDHRRYFCVVGSEIATTMRAAGDGHVVGETIMVDGIVYTVVGVLRSGSRGPREFAISRAVVIPISTAQRVLGRFDIPRLIARTNPDAHYLEAMADVSDYFRRRSPELVVRVESPMTLIEQMHNQMRLFTLLLGAVGAISLFVGGIGIMNVMLISVSERRLEIGIRRALGARRRDIQWQFLIESLILSLLGGFVGIGLGIGTSYGISQFMDWTVLVPVVSVVLGVGVAGAVGLSFGYYPAWRGARLDPITALRERG